jgi:AraC-like DNA-binding protein
MTTFSRVLGSPFAGVYSTHIDSDQRFGRHWHDTYGFGFLEHGAQAWFSGRGTVRGYPGDVISTNPGEVHDGRPLGQSTRRWRIVYVDVDLMARVTDRARPAEIAQPVLQDAVLLRGLRSTFTRLERWNACATEQARRVQALAFEEALVESSVRLLSLHGSAPRAPAVPSADLQQVRERLADDSPSVPDLAELARMTGLSRYQVLRRFTKAYGLPPHAWLLRRRAERARRLIRDGRALAAAALECGFVDQSHMTRAFVRQFGFTPGAWRKAQH